jgi:hypothetical protein
MKRTLRILRIWWCGKMPYAKRVRRWIKGQLFRDLQKEIPNYVERMKEKYSPENFKLFSDYFLHDKS